MLLSNTKNACPSLVTGLDNGILNPDAGYNINCS